MDKKEQSFSFSDFPGHAVLNEDKHKVVSLSPAIKLTPASAADITATEVNGPIAIKGMPAETINAIPLTGKIVEQHPADKALNVIKTTTAKTNNQPLKMTPAIEIPTKNTESSVIIKIAPSVNNNIDTNLTDEISSQNNTNTVSMKKIPIIPTESVRININSSITEPEVKIQLTAEKVNPVEEKVKPSKEKIKPVKEKVNPVKEKVKPSKEKIKPAKLNIEIESPKLEIRFGADLKSARLSKGLTIVEVENKTKIGKIYIEALEAENLTILPPIVYVYAYVKNLCQIYEINDEVRNNILFGLKKLLPTHLPHETIHSLNIDYEVDTEEEHKLKLIVTSSLASIIIISIVIAVSIWLMNSDGNHKKQPSSIEKIVAFNRNKLIELSPHQSVKMTTLNHKQKITNSK